jgi:hypothetical protein
MEEKKNQISKNVNICDVDETKDVTTPIINPYLNNSVKGNFYFTTSKCHHNFFSCIKKKGQIFLIPSHWHTIIYLPNDIHEHITSLGSQLFAKVFQN